MLRRSCAITRRIVRQSHSPLHAKPLEAGGWGRSWCLCFLEVVRCVVVVCWEMVFCACSDFVTRRWCLARIWIKSTVCRVWYEHTFAFVWKSDSNFFSFILSQHLFLSLCNLKSGQRKMFRICEVTSKCVTTYWESLFSYQKDDFSYWKSLFTYKSPYFHTESPF